MLMSSPWRHGDMPRDDFLDKASFALCEEW